MLTRARRLSTLLPGVYASYFGLAERPFPLPLILGTFTSVTAIAEALAHLLYGVSEGGGFVLLTGEIGTGKTTVCRALLDQLPSDVDVAVIFNPRLTSLELVASICDDLRVPYRRGVTSPKTLLEALSRALLEAHGRGRRTVLVVDEAQNLGVDVLAELRLLTNLETTRDKLLHLVLIGQPELDALLRRSQLRQLAQRLTARHHLRPFSYRDTAAYVEHRLRVAGQRAPLFTGRALRLVHQRSGGVPRLINTVCDRALLGAFARTRRQVTAAVVHRAAFEVLGPSARTRWAPAAAAAAVILSLLSFAVALGPTRLSLLARGWASNVRLVAPAAVPRTPPPPTVLPSPLTFAAILNDEPAARDKHRAFATLYSLWDVAYAVAAGRPGCDYGRNTGLQCLVRVGTWSVLRRLDLPAILTLKTPDGEPRYAVVVALIDTAATLAVGPRRLSLGLPEVERFWDGDFVALWRPPVVGRALLRPGMGGRDIAWLRQRLDEAERRDADSSAALIYDEDLKRRVIAFQHAHALVPDGIVGEETLARLATVGDESGAPSLSGRRR